MLIHTPGQMAPSTAHSKVHKGTGPGPSLHIVQILCHTKK